MSDYQGQPPPSWSGEPHSRTGVVFAVAALIVLLVGGAVAAVLLLRSDNTSSASPPAGTTQTQDTTTQDTTTQDTTTQDTTTQDTSTSEATTSVTTQPTTTEPSSSETTASSEPTGPHLTPGQSFCERFEKNAASNEFDNLDPADTDKLVAELKVFRQLAPAQLKDDYLVLIGAVEGDPAPELQTSVASIQTYAVDNCDVTLDGS